MKNRHASRTHRQLVPADAGPPAGRASGAVPIRDDVVRGASVQGAVAQTAGGCSGSATTLAPLWFSRRVLLLNATYEPLTALPARRAVVLMACGKADTVHEDADAPVVHSAEFSLAVPAVIRLRDYVRVPYRARVPLTRAGLMHRDGFRCAYCGAKAETIDHVVPRSRGGTHSWENCVACCAPCNHRKADKMLGELGWTLRGPLVPPSGPHWRLLSSTKELHPSWMQYLGEGAA
ncbi:HNH endonuclease [Rhodococcus sp. HNM0569]|uniref:HNH endonuclease n=1 Tax=Rhodococcus sp. HNM0569 TaxID=2716340 RepID=UPI00146F8543|nr:HNH endonuclease [Rhodococcus sp. HNM0569]NLU83998.1 HNH endonuclease [Rhodococcus sp. HNM0569]